MTITKYDPFTEVDFPTGVRLFQDAVNRLFSEPVAARPWAPAQMDTARLIDGHSQWPAKSDIASADSQDIHQKTRAGCVARCSARETRCAHRRQ